tara:strand:- start:13443 stop:14282 length:840 start_codon:yes stop_codon:yes gene_type:complete
MSLKADLYLFSDLAVHRRGAVISEYLSVKSLGSDSELPTHGILLMFGLEWQTYTQQQQEDLMAWLKSSGRAVLLIPPFSTGLLADAMGWHVEGVNGDKSASINGLAQSLADETRFQFKAVSHQFSREYAHNWSDDSLNTLYYKPHSSGGLLAATSLPIWSLTCLDIPELVQSWLSGLNEMTGRVQERLPAVITIFTPNEKHFALLCCANGQAFKDGCALVQRVERLGLFRFLPEELDVAVAELEEENLFLNGELTEKGLAIVMASPYKIYADELKRMPG